MKKALKVVLISIVSAALLGAGFTALLYFYCNRKEQALNEAWGKVQIPLEAIPEKFPATQDNDSALALEEKAAALGFCLSPDCLKNHRHEPTPAAASEFQKIKEAQGNAPTFADFINQQLEKPGPELDPLPDHFLKYLTTHAADITALRERVLQSDPPQWGYDLRSAEVDPMPNLLGILSVQRVLLLDAMNRMNQRDEPGAGADLEAAWKFSAGLERNPMLVAQLILIASRAYQAGMLRKFRAPLPQWEKRLSDYDPRAAIALSATAESWYGRQSVATHDRKQLLKYFNEQTGGDPLPVLIRPLPTPILRQLFRASLLDAETVRLRRLDEFKRLDPCESPAALMVQRKDLQIAWWNILFREYLHSSWNRANRMAMRLESARKILALKTARNQAKDHRWPATVPGIEASVCTDGKWTYFAYPDGTMSLSFNKPFQNQKLQFDKGLKGADIPIDYRENPVVAAR